MSNAIEIESLSKTYNKKKSAPVIAVDNVSLSVPKGQVIAFLGPNGAGKTTTIKMMCGLVTPDSGNVHLNGYHVGKQRREAMEQIGVVLEGTRNIYWRLTAMQNLLYFARLKGKRGQHIKDRAKRLLTELDLIDRKDDPVGQFSRGMQQKVAIACALMANPPIVLLDEPTLGLDVQAARTVKTWVRELATEHNITVVLTTHQLDMAQEVCDRVAIVRKGKIIADGSTHELLDQFRQEHYEITLKGHINGDAPPALATLTKNIDNGNTIFSGGIDSQNTLYEILEQVRGLGMNLVSVQNVEPDLEEVFVQLVEKGDD